MAVLSLQSFVTYGHVGNSAALPPMQAQGFEIWPLPTAILAHHPGHGRPAARTTPPNEVEDVVDSLAKLGVLAQCRAVLTGWLGSAGNAAAALDAVDQVRALNPHALWLCDPVIGDRAEGIYVDAALPPLFRDRLLPRADIATPNQFELEWFSGQKADTLAGALAACRVLLSRGTRIVVCTSLQRHDRSAGEIEALAVTADGAWIAGTPELNNAPHGAGDMFAALFLARLLKGKSVKKALGFATAATYGVLAASVEAGQNEPLLVAARAELVLPTTTPRLERVA